MKYVEIEDLKFLEEIIKDAEFAGRENTVMHQKRIRKAVSYMFGRELGLELSKR